MMVLLLQTPLNLVLKMILTVWLRLLFKVELLLLQVSLAVL